MLIDPVAMVYSAAMIAAAIALLNGCATGVGQGIIGASAITAVARQPECKNNIQGPMFITLAMAETSGIYGLVFAIILLWGNPLLGQYLDRFVV